MKLMKFVPFFLFVITCCTSYAHENAKFSHKENVKIYINLSDIQFDEAKIYVHVNQNWLQTNALFSDNQGMYIYDNYNGWTCSRCGKHNEDRWQCSKCGYRPRDEKIENN